MSNSLKYLQASLLLLMLIYPHAILAEEEDGWVGDSVTEQGIGNVENKDDVRPRLSSALPFITYRVHNNNRFWHTITNTGVLGNNAAYRDVINRGRVAPAFHYPLYAPGTYGTSLGLWVGGLVGTDTLVSCTSAPDAGQEFLPEAGSLGDFIDLSGDSDVDFGDLVSRRAEQVYQCTYMDTNPRPTTVPYDRYEGRFHKPLNLKVTQTSYSWAFSFAEDFILIDYVIDNLGDQDITKAWLGIYTQSLVRNRSEQPPDVPRYDDFEGYIDTWPYEVAPFGEPNEEKVRLTYYADNDGQPTSDRWLLEKMQNVVGIAPMALPFGARRNNFNWWTTNPHNWGPRLRATDNNPFRNYPEGLGVPYGDKSKYSMLSKAEIDYNGLEAALNYTPQGWLAPHPNAARIGDGHFVNTLSSYGPVTIPAGGQTRLTIVVSVGENLHTDASAWRRLYNGSRPQNFLKQLDFTDLIRNVRTARSIYDNPGVDTDGDGFAGDFGFFRDSATGEFRIVYLTGDGVPDFKGAGPPTPPNLRVTAGDGTLTIRWNGRETENTFDQFSNSLDFEGYRVWKARTLNEQEWSLVASYDRENFSRFAWSTTFNKFVLASNPLSTDSLKTLYGQSFDPLDYPGPGFPFTFGNDIFYFEPVDYNRSDLIGSSGIRKVYPDATKDTSDVDSEGRMRYYEYECTIDGLLPTVPYYVAVTTFDHGNRLRGIDPLESSQTENAVEFYPRLSGDSTVLENGKLNVYVYPNPYRVDGGYAEQGYENRQTDLSNDRARSIWFANLPNKCKISVYSLDGDLIRDIYHNEPPGSGNASIERFDLITRNRNALVSGLYYWVVESDYGTQMGKLVVIK